MVEQSHFNEVACPISNKVCRLVSIEEIEVGMVTYTVPAESFTQINPVTHCVPQVHTQNCSRLSEKQHIVQSSTTHICTAC